MICFKIYKQMGNKNKNMNKWLYKNLNGHLEGFNVCLFVVKRY